MPDKPIPSKKPAARKPSASAPAVAPAKVVFVPKDGRSPDCSPAENQMWDDVLAGRPCRLDLVFSSEAMRRISAEELCRLCCSEKVHPSGIQIFCGVFEGDIELSNIKFSFGLDFRGCIFQNGIYLSGSSCNYLYMHCCIVKGDLFADYLIVNQSVYLVKYMPYPQSLDSENVNLNETFVAKGQVDFSGAKIGGQFACKGGRFEFEGEKCLDAQSIEVTLDVILDNYFFAKGIVDFFAAKIGGQLYCTDGEFLGKNCSINLHKAIIKGDTYLSSYFKNFYSIGLLNMTDVCIEGNLLIGKEDQDGRFYGSAGKLEGGILLDGAEISGTFHFAPIQCGQVIDLRGASIGKMHDCYALIDNSPIGWWGTRIHDICKNASDRWYALFPSKKPEKQTEGDSRQKQYKLYGLRYKELEPGMCNDWRELVEWIRNADEEFENGVRKFVYHPQPYERLAAVLQAQGHENEASEVLIARRRHRLQNLTWPRRFAEIVFYDIPILFGYKPWQAIYFAIAFVLFGTFLFQAADRQKVMVPADGDVLTASVQRQREYVVQDNVIADHLHRKYQKPDKNVDWDAEKRVLKNEYSLVKKYPVGDYDDNGQLKFVPEGYPHFNCFFYALDAFLPIVDLRQAQLWLPNRATRLGDFCFYAYWTLDIFGWFLTTLLVSSLTGLVRGKDTETIEP